MKVDSDGLYGYFDFLFTDVEVSDKSVGVAVLVVGLDANVTILQVLKEGLMVEVGQINAPVDHIDLHGLHLYVDSFHLAQLYAQQMSHLVILADLGQQIVQCVLEGVRQNA